MKLVPPWIWLVVGVLVLAGAWGVGYHQGSVKWQVKLGVEKAAWESREKVYQTDADTAEKNLADEKKTRKAAEDSAAAMVKASAEAVRERDEAKAAAAALSSRLAELEAAQDAEVRPLDCPSAFTQLATHLAALNGAIYATANLSPPGGAAGPGGVPDGQALP